MVQREYYAIPHILHIFIITIHEVPAWQLILHVLYRIDRIVTSALALQKFIRYKSIPITE